MGSERKNKAISYSDIKLLNQIGQDFSSYLDFDSVIDIIIHRVKNVLQCEASSVILFDKAEDSLVFYEHRVQVHKRLRGLQFQKEKGWPDGFLIIRNQLLLKMSIRIRDFI